MQHLSCLVLYTLHNVGYHKLLYAHFSSLFLDTKIQTKSELNICKTLKVFKIPGFLLKIGVKSAYLQDTHHFILRPHFLQFLEIWFEKSGLRNLVREIWLEKFSSRNLVREKWLM